MMNGLNLLIDNFNKEMGIVDDSHLDDRRESMNDMYLVDTNVLLNVPEMFDMYDNIIVTSDIFRELECLELKASAELKYNIRRAKRQLKAHIDELIYLDDMMCEYYSKEYIPEGYSETYVDNRLLACARGLIKEDEDNICILTNDILLQLKLSVLEIPFEEVDYIDKSYNGVYRFEYSDIIQDSFTDSVLLDLMRSPVENPLELKYGQYLELFNVDYQTVKGTFIFEGDSYKRISPTEICNEIMTLRPLNTRQKFAFELMQDDNKRIKVLTGFGGTGKDIIMLSQAMYEIEMNGMSVVWLKPNKGIKEVGSIGALPGDKYDKMRDTYIQIADYMGDEILLDRYIEDGKIVIENMEFIRGRQFNNSIIYCTEAQNLTEEMIKLIISRAGENTFIYFNGDMEQSDIGSTGGLYALNKLAGNEMFGKVELIDVERSDVAKLAELL